jgi:hypothetical protein
MFLKNIFLVLFVLSISLIAFSQNPKSGKYLFRFFDIEYGKFHGTCVVTVKGDSIKVVAKEDCHRKLNELITEGILKKDKSTKWIIVPYKKNEEDYFDKIDFTKKIFYTY